MLMAILDPAAGEPPAVAERLQRVRACDRALLLIGLAGSGTASLPLSSKGTVEKLP